MKKVFVKVFVLLLAATPAVAWAQTPNPFADPIPTAQPAGPAPVATGTARHRGGRGGVALKMCDKEGKKIPAKQWTKERCEKEAECQFGTDDKGLCLTWQEALEAHDAKLAAEVRETAWWSLSGVSLLLALIFLLATLKLRGQMQEEHVKYKAVLEKYNQRLHALEHSRTQLPADSPPPESTDSA